MKTSHKVILITIVYLVFATPWYFSFKSNWPLILGIPLWAFLTIFIILGLGYLIAYVAHTIKPEEVSVK